MADKGVAAFTAATDVFGGKQTAKPTGPFAPQYITFVYIPSAILIAGTALLNVAWTPYAVAVAAALGGYQFYANRQSSNRISPSYKQLLTCEKRNARSSILPSSRSSPNIAEHTTNS